MLFIENRSGTNFYLFIFGLGPYPAVLRAYPWLCSEITPGTVWGQGSNPDLLHISQVPYLLQPPRNNFYMYIQDQLNFNFSSFQL